MTPDPDKWEDQIERLFSELSGLPCCWRDRERPFVQDAICLLAVTSDEPIGVDERRYVYDATAAVSNPPAELLPTQCGLRRMILQVQVDAYSQDAAVSGRRYAQLIRMRLRRPSALATLATIDTSHIQTLPIIAVDHTDDNRAYSRATMDVVLHRAETDSDKPMGSISQVKATGNLEDATGTVVISEPFTIDLPDP